jgi:hypothetical protein
MYSHYITGVKGRVDSNKDCGVGEIRTLVDKAEVRLFGEAGRFETFHWSANIHGVVIRLITNSRHLYEFWVENWYPAPRSHTVLPHGVIYAVTGISGEAPRAYYNHETKTAVFVNTEYYGQCKSWALGMAADILETQHGIHSIHGSCAVVKGRGVVIIAPTGTGKSTHTWGLMQLPDGKIHSDDWIFLQYKKGLAMADISERKFYLRTDMVRSFPEIAPLLEKSMCENVVDNDFTAFGNSRALLDPEWIAGPDKFVERTAVACVILLRRDKESLPELNLNADEAVRILEEGRVLSLAGAGAKDGEFTCEPYYNPYLLVRRHKMQNDFFRLLFSAATCHILNTGVEGVNQTQARIRRIVDEA